VGIEDPAMERLGPGDEVMGCSHEPLLL